MKKLVILLLLLFCCFFCIAEVDIRINLGSLIPYMFDMNPESYLMKIPILFQFTTGDFFSIDFSIDGILYPVYLVNGGLSVGVTWFIFGNAPKGFYLQNHLGTSWGLISLYSSSSYSFYDEASFGYQFILGKKEHFVLALGGGAIYYYFEEYQRLTIFADVSFGYRF